jgi:hypothetical protein
LSLRESGWNKQKKKDEYAEFKYPTDGSRQSPATSISQTPGKGQKKAKF